MLVFAATNRPDLLDVALLRPGRLDTHIFLGLPDVEAREKILQVHLGSVPTRDVSIREIAAPDTPISRPNSTWLLFRTFLTLYSRLFIVASPFLARALRGGSPAGFASFGRRHPNSPVGMPIANRPYLGRS